MDGKLLFCVSVGQGDNLLYGPEWKEAERGISLVDLFLQVCGSKILGQQVQVLVSRDREFLEGAIVQVCCPLSHLAEKSQSYIKFIIKGEHQLPKNAFWTQFTPERDANYKPPQERITSLCMNDPLVKEKWLIKSDTAMLHTLATKPTFENMTVEEICDEIRNIRKTEMSKNKLAGWIGDEKSHPINASKSATNSIIKEVEHDDEVNIPQTPEKTKKSPVPKASLPKSSPLPPKKKGDVKRTTSFRSNKSFKRLSENTRNKLNGKKHVDNRNKDKDKTPPSKNVRAIGNNSKNISERLSILAQPRRRHSDANLVTSPTLASSTHSTHSARNSSLNNKRSMEIKSTLDAKSPSLERLNRKSRDSITNSTFIKGCDTNDKTSCGGVSKKLAQKPKAKKKSESNEPYFIEIYAKDKPENRSKEDHKDSSKGTNIKYPGGNIISNSHNKVSPHGEQSRNNSKHRLKNSKIEKNASNASRSDSSVELRKDSLVSYHDDNKAAEHACDNFIPPCISPVRGCSERNGCNSVSKQRIGQPCSADSSLHSFSSNRVMSVDNLLASINAEADKTNRVRHESLSVDDKNSKNDMLVFTGIQYQGNETKNTGKVDRKSNELLGAHKLDKDIRDDIANISRDILHSSGGNTSLENIIDTYLSPSPTKIPTNLVLSPTRTATKSPLFTQLLEKNNLKQSSSRSNDSSLDDVLDTTNDSKESISSSKYIEHESRIGSRSGAVLPERESDKKQNKNVNSSDSDCDRYSKIPIKRLSPQKSKADEANKMWANSRGIKFTKEVERPQPLHVTDLECEDSSETASSHPTKTSSGESQLEKPRHSKSLEIKIGKSPKEEKRRMHLPLTLYHSSLPSTSTPTDGIKGILSPMVNSPKKPRSGSSTPDRNRKLWGNSIDGMDTIVIPSLQAFSLELRTLSETVTCNLTALYESFQCKFGGLDVTAIDGSNRAFTPTSPRTTENGGDQQGVAIVFRNLRKIEGQLRTIEHVTFTMLNTLNERTNNPINLAYEKVEGIDESRKVSWGELKNVPGSSNSNLTYWLNDQERTKESNSESNH